MSDRRTPTLETALREELRAEQAAHGELRAAVLAYLAACDALDVDRAATASLELRALVGVP